MKTAAVVLLLAAVVVGCGGGSSNESGVDIAGITWKQGPAPQTGDDRWASLPAGTDIDELCNDLYADWPTVIESEPEVTLIAGSERLICVKQQ